MMRGSEQQILFSPRSGGHLIFLLLHLLLIKLSITALILTAALGLFLLPVATVYCFLFYLLFMRKLNKVSWFLDLQGGPECTMKLLFVLNTNTDNRGQKQAC